MFVPRPFIREDHTQASRQKAFENRSGGSAVDESAKPATGLGLDVRALVVEEMALHETTDADRAPSDRARSASAQERYPSECTGSVSEYPEHASDRHRAHGRSETNRKDPR
jgi:hypothetical protein